MYSSVREQHPCCGQPWPAMPSVTLELAQRAKEHIGLWRVGRGSEDASSAITPLEVKPGNRPPRSLPIAVLICGTVDASPAFRPSWKQQREAHQDVSSQPRVPAAPSF